MLTIEDRDLEHEIIGRERFNDLGDLLRLDRVTEAYAARAVEYVGAVGKITHATEADKTFVLEWARTLDGLVLDVGSGPGQWTDFLREEGIDVEGVEPTVAFLEEARRRYPRSTFQNGRAEQLNAQDSSLGGILAWFSLIHTPPQSIDEAFAEFARCIKPGGGLAVGFFSGADGEPFDHAITTAYYWSVDGLTKHLLGAGFTVLDSQVRSMSGERPQGKIIAQR